MPISVHMLAVQASETLIADRLQAIMWSQIIMAAIMVLCALAVLGAALAVYLLVRKLMSIVEESRDQLLPHVTPILSRASTIADDVRQITADFKGDADAVHDAVKDVLERSRTATDSLEERARHFAMVLDAVQTQAEDLLMDAASTAHGLQAAARALRGEEPLRPLRRERADAEKPKARETK